MPLWDPQGAALTSASPQVRANRLSPEEPHGNQASGVWRRAWNRGKGRRAKLRNQTNWVKSYSASSWGLWQISQGTRHVNKANLGSPDQPICWPNAMQRPRSMSRGTGMTTRQALPNLWTGKTVTYNEIVAIWDILFCKKKLFLCSFPSSEPPKKPIISYPITLEKIIFKEGEKTLYSCKISLCPQGSARKKLSELGVAG